MPTETVLITGCSSGIGRETARAFNEEGWQVYATSRDVDDVSDLEADGCQTAALDVTDQQQVDNVVDRIIEDEGHIDCLVNNAGYGQLGPVEDVSTEKVQAQFDVNVFGPHRLVRAVLPHMRSRERGSIINVSSITGRVSTPGTGVYSASKFAMEALSDALRSEVAAFGVDVVLVEPGPVDTEFTERVESEVEELEKSTGAYGDIYRIIEDFQVVGGGGPGAVQPRDVARTILNAASSTEPLPRYPVGALSRYLDFVRFVPDRWRDAVYSVLVRVMSSRLVSR